MLVITIAVVATSLLGLLVTINQIDRERVLAENINIYASVGACQVNFRVRPDNRTAFNWGTYIEVDVHNPSGTYIGNFTGTTNANGELFINFCNEGISAYSAGVYTFEVRGLSHLTESIPYYFPAVSTQTVDLSTTSQGLTPGDINGPSFGSHDDEVNSLDMAKIIDSFGLNFGDAGYDAINDLNYDQTIDFTDLQIMLQNTYLSPNHNDALYDFPVDAATFEFEPSTQIFNSCSATVDLYIDVTGQTATAADIEIFYPEDLITISDADLGTAGVQITEGTAFPTYFGNQVKQSSGQVLLSAAAISCVPPTTSPSYRLVNQRVKFASITMNYKSNDPGTVILDIRYEGTGNTTDSNIASIAGADLLNNDSLLNGGDGTFTFEPLINCVDPEGTTSTTGGGSDGGIDDSSDGGTDGIADGAVTDGGSTNGQVDTTGTTTGISGTTGSDNQAPGENNIFLQSAPIIILGCTTFTGLLLILLAPRELVILVEGAEFAAIHTVPDLTGNIIYEVHNKETIEPIDETDDWYKIEFNNQEGWVYKSNTSKRFKWLHRDDEDN